MNGSVTHYVVSLDSLNQPYKVTFSSNKSEFQKEQPNTQLYKRDAENYVFIESLKVNERGRSAHYASWQAVKRQQCVQPAEKQAKQPAFNTHKDTSSAW